MTERWVRCEGSGCGVHDPYGLLGVGRGTCSMCGVTVAAPTNGIAMPHTRLDLLAMIDEGEFDD